MNEILCPWCKCPDFEYYATPSAEMYICGECGEKPNAETLELLQERAWDRYYMTDMSGYAEQ